MFNNPAMKSSIQALKETLSRTPVPVFIVMGCLLLGIVALSVFRSSVPYHQVAQTEQTMICPACGGAGQVERPGLIMKDMPVIYTKQTCGVCGGTGRIKAPAN